MILLCFALPHESRKLLGSLTNKTWMERGPLPVIRGHLGGRGGHGEQGGRELLVFHTGVGRALARERCQRVLSLGPAQCLISAGYCGGLDPQLTTGSLILAGNFSDPGLLTIARELLIPPKPSIARQETGAKAMVGVLSTQDLVVETPAAKQQVAKATAAHALDMETSAIHCECVRFSMPMLSIRAVSDPVDLAMPVPGTVWFDSTLQKPRVLPLLGYLATHPGCIKPFARFVAGTSYARSELTKFLENLVPALPL